MHTPELATLIANLLCFLAVRFHAQKAAAELATVVLKTAAEVKAELPIPALTTTPPA